MAVNSRKRKYLCLEMTTKRKKVTATMEQKLQAFFRIDAGESLTKIARDLGVGKQTVSDWKKKRKEIEDFCAKMDSKDSLCTRSTLKKPKHETLDEALYSWFCQQREEGIPLSGATLQAVALIINENLKGDPAFTASVGWLSRWKERHGVRHGELGGRGDNVVVEDFKIKSENLQPCQVFNGDKTGLNYKMLPKKTASKLDSVANNRKVKPERLSLRPWGNSSGDLKLPLSVIGKSAKPSIGNQILSEDEIVEVCIESPATVNDCIEDDDTDVEELVDLTHGEATVMLEKLMTYFEKQSDTSSAELQTLRHLRDRTAKQCLSLKQKNISKFFH